MALQNKQNRFRIPYTLVSTSIVFLSFGAALLIELRPFLISELEANEWPGTILLKDKALLRKFTLDNGSVAILKKYANSLYEWQQPNLLEDLCFYKLIDGEVWMATISHENDGYFEITENEFSIMLTMFPYLKEYICKDINNEL